MRNSRSSIRMTSRFAMCGTVACLNFKSPTMSYWVTAVVNFSKKERTARRTLILRRYPCWIDSPRTIDIDIDIDTCSVQIINPLTGKPV